jgi:hypothetical protein
MIKQVITSKHVHSSRYVRWEDPVVTWLVVESIIAPCEANRK